MSDLKINVTIKFTSKEEVLSAIPKLEQLGYTNDLEWNHYKVRNIDAEEILCIHIYNFFEFSVYSLDVNPGNPDTIIYESFTEFENSLNH